PIDMVMLALTLGATFVARGFSGDKGQLVPLIKAAVEHKGAAFIDVVSPCVAFNNHPGSTKSYDYVRAHNEAVNRLDFITERAPIVADPAPGGMQEVLLHDGGTLRLRKLAADYDPRDKIDAMTYLESRRAAGEVVTGLLYVDPDHGDMHEALGTTHTPLNALRDAELVPGANALAAFNDSLR
ncbi:MAG TPA: 2-oxoacid:ferredoxin oxidoreductase subunit beta, partial [Casimicrobiaceae bacterium]